MEIGNQIWVSGDAVEWQNKNPWNVAKVASKKIDGETTIIEVENVRKEKATFTIAPDEESQVVKMSNNIDPEKVANLVALPYVNDPEVVHILGNRFEKGHIYTQSGPILLALNPFGYMPVSNEAIKYMKEYASSIKELAVKFDTEEYLTAINNASADKPIRSHSIVICGESGSGKTEIAKLLLKNLSKGTLDRPASEAISSKKGNLPAQNTRPLSVLHKDMEFYQTYKVGVIDKILQVSPILEALGNAKTLYNSNSSRLGKYVDLMFTDRGDLIGGEIGTYLLEHVRIVKQLKRERNFHIFYMLASGASEEQKQLLLLREAADYRLLNQGGSISVDDRDDAADFVPLQKQFQTLGFSQEKTDMFFSIVAGILHLGQIKFAGKLNENNEDVCEIDTQTVGCFESTETELATAARLLGFPVDKLELAITTRSQSLGKDLYLKKLDTAHAASARDALAKVIYNQLFAWIVHEINAHIAPSEEVLADVDTHIGILDIYGFASFPLNTFEQLLMNYSSEAIQNQFYRKVFKAQTKVYEEEHISYRHIHFPDNTDSMDAIANGVFKVLDDQCRLPNRADNKFAKELYHILTKKPRLQASKLMQGECKFSIVHYSGTSVYTTENFIDKNLEEVPQSAYSLMLHSGHSAMSTKYEHNMLPAPEGAEAGKPAPTPVGSHSGSMVRRDSAMTTTRGPGGPSAVAHFRSEVDVLIKTIDRTTPHYVRCINPFRSAFMKASSENRNFMEVSKGLEKKASDLSYSYTDLVEAANAPNTKKNDKLVANFDDASVLDQLKTGGVFDAIQVERSGFTVRLRHSVFYTRYRVLANPAHPATASLPRILPSNVDPKEVSDLCNKLISTFTGQDLSINNRLSGRVDLNLTKGDGRKSIYHAAASIKAYLGDPKAQIAEGSIQTGKTRVFLRKGECDLLESRLFELDNIATDVLIALLRRNRLNKKIKARVQKRKEQEKKAAEQKKAAEVKAAAPPPAASAPAAGGGCCIIQ